MSGIFHEFNVSRRYKEVKIFVRHTQFMVQTQSLNVALELKWNKKLSGRYALAPREWQERIHAQIREGLITQKEADDLYKQHCKEYDEACSDYVKSELSSMALGFGEQALAHGVVSVFGIGLGRGLGFIPQANSLKMNVDLYDVSQVAIKKAEKIFLEMNVNGMNATHQQEITGQEGEFNVEDTMLLYMANFLQILSREQIIAIGNSVGKWLALPHRRAVIVHPSEYGNEKAMWGDTTPYTKAELLAPIAESLKGPVRVEDGSDIDYFRCHRYSIFTISG